MGAGVSGAMCAEALTARGLSVAVFDRRVPARGATTASTALVMWAADIPLTKLAARIGPGEAARRWRRVHRAVLDLDRRIAALGIDCAWTSRPEIYLAGDVLDASGLRGEAAARKAADLPSRYLGPEAVWAEFGLVSAALASADAFQVDPVALTLGLLETAQARGAILTFPIDVAAIDETGDGARLILDDGHTVQAGAVVLASGYELAPRFAPPGARLGSSYAIATSPGQTPSWREGAMIWQSSDPYLYARSTADGRIIVGGEDEEIVDAAARDALLPAKRAALERKGAALLGIDGLEASCAWSATFGGSPDGLPFIGKARGSTHVWLAAGFGGNGITFAALASDLIAADLTDSPDPDADAFDPWRFA